MFKTRLISGICLVIIAVALIMTGGNVLLAALAVISLIGMFELYRVVGIEKSALGAAGFLAAALYYVMLYFRPETDAVPAVFFIAVLMVLLAVYVLTFPKYRAEQVLTAFFGLFYVAVMLSYIYRTRVMDGGYLVWLIFLSSWGCDTCAYCVGMLIGKHKMAPKLSPKKSIEGSIGGVAGATVLGAVFGAVFAAQIKLPNPVLGCAVICFVGAWISQLGDLAASAIKRNHEVKDYGRLIPGHGGILDRFDSVIFVAPAIYFTALCLLQGSKVWGLFF